MLSKLNLIRFTVLAIIFTASATGLPSQSQHSLQIEYPVDGMVFNPGQTIRVRVTSPSDGTWSFLGVIGQKPLPTSEVAHSVPAEFSIKVPSKVDECRRYPLTAMGRTVAGDLVESDPVNIDIERSDTLVSLSSFQAPSLTLEPKESQFHLIILATFSDGSDSVVTESSYITYRSGNTAVATVDHYGAITPVAPGTGSITVTYKNPNGERVQLSVPVTVRKSNEKQ